MQQERNLVRISGPSVAAFFGWEVTTYFKKKFLDGFDSACKEKQQMKQTRLKDM